VQKQRKSGPDYALIVAMIPADLKLPDDVDALKAMILGMAKETARAAALEAEVAALKATNATANERIARLTSILRMLETGPLRQKLRETAR
jgi:hypothetical protein